jgi:hypothetical protein
VRVILILTWRSISVRRRGGREVVLEEIRLVIFFKLYIDGMTDDDEG